MTQDDAHDYSRFISENLHYKYAKAAQIDLLKSWLQKPRIQQHWGDGGLAIPDYSEFTKGKTSIFKHYYGYDVDRPVVYFMTSIIEDEDGLGQWRAKNGLTLSIDMMIGADEYEGKGIAHLILEKFIQKKCSNADAIITDPELSHTKAIRVYEKTGFSRVGLYSPNSGQWSGVQHQIMRKMLS